MKARIDNRTITLGIKLSNGYYSSTEYYLANHSLVYSLAELSKEIKLYIARGVYAQRFYLFLRGEYEINDSNLFALIQFLSAHKDIESLLLGSQDLNGKFIINEENKLRLNNYICESENIIFCSGDMFLQFTLDLASTRFYSVPLIAGIMVKFADETKEVIVKNYKYTDKALQDIAKYYTSVKNSPLSSYSGLKIEIDISSGVVFDVKNQDLTAIKRMLEHATQLRVFTLSCKSHKRELYRYSIETADILNDAIIAHPSIIDADYPLKSDKASGRILDRKLICEHSEIYCR